jgi:hypothetical protein
MHTEIRDDTPEEKEIRVAVAELTNGRSAGVSRMRAEHLKGWLKGAKLEEDPKTGPANVGAGEDWEALVKLVQAVWDKGKIPTQLGWVVTVLIPKGGGDYCGIGLFETIWKVIERVIDKRLEAIVLHDSLHGCRNGRGTGTAVVEAKLTQQLAHLKQTPFYGVFIDLKKALMRWIGSAASCYWRDMAPARTCAGSSAISGTRLQTCAGPWGIMARLTRQAVE